MKKIFLTAVITIAVFFSSLPYFVGRLQYSNVVAVCQNFGNECNDDLSTDSEIENVLSVYNFDIDALQPHPFFADYYRAGYLTILHF